MLRTASLMRPRCRGRRPRGARRRRRGRRRSRAGRGAPPRACPAAITLPNSRTTTRSQTPSTSPMSWSTSSAPCRRRRRGAAGGRAPRSRRVQAGAGLVETDEARRGGQRPRHADELALDPVRARRGACRRGPPGPRRRAPRAPRPRRAGPQRTSPIWPARRARGGDGEVLAHGEVVEELAGLPRAREAAAGARVRRPVRESRPSSWNRPARSARSR